MFSSKFTMNWEFSVFANSPYIYLIVVRVSQLYCSNPLVAGLLPNEQNNDSICILLFQHVV